MNKLKGVNLGGWLVLERWITPSLFQGTIAQDESSLSSELGNKKSELLQRHYETFITNEDFVWIKEHGLNAVRIPVGYWVFGDEQPYEGAIEHLDRAFKLAEANGLKILLDLHSAPGSQNGYDHSGVKGKIDWHKSHENIDRTLDLIEKLAERYASSKSLYGIELLNEPSSQIPHALLVDFYEQGYARVRKYCSEDVAVVISDAYRPFDWKGDMQEPMFKNVILDTHMYQVFAKEDQRLGIHGHIKKAKYSWADDLDKMGKQLWVMVGEWSLGIPHKATRGLDTFERDMAMKAFASAQLKTFEKSQGWFFWTYKNEDKAGWSMRESVSRGWLPPDYSID